MVTRGNEAHLFLVCPFAWTKPIATTIVKSAIRILTGMDQDGDKADFHVLSAYPLPKRVKVFLNGPLELLKFWR